MKNNRLANSPLARPMLMLIIAVAIGAGVYVYNQNSDTKPKPTTVSSANTQSGLPLKYDKSKLPKDWKPAVIKIEKKAANIQLSNEKTGCFAGIFYTTDTAESNAPTVDHYQALLDSQHSKGYTAEITDTTVIINTPNGNKTIPAKSATVTGDHINQHQIYSYISTDKYFEGVQLSCADAANLPLAQDAALAITVVHSE